MSKLLEKRAFWYALDLAILFAFWWLFYFPIWSGARHVGYDMDGFNYPIDRYMLAGLKGAHHLPQWDWFEYNGVDLAGNIQAAAYYPPKLILLLGLLVTRQELSYPLYQLFALLHVFALSVATYAIGRKLGCDRFWALVAGLLLSYTGILQAQIQHLWFLETLPWIPIAAYGAYSFSLNRSLSSFALYAFGTTGMLLVGYPLQFLTIQLEIVLAALLIRLTVAGDNRFRNAAWPAAGFLGAQFVACALSAVALLPFLHLSSGSIAETHGSPLPLSTLLTFVIPNAYGHLTGNYTIGENPSTSFYFVGGALELFVLLSPVAGRAIAKNASPYAVALLFVVLNLFLIFGPLTDYLHAHAQALDVIRPQSACMPFAVAFATLVVLTSIAAERASIRRAGLFIRIAMTIACATLFFNRPAYFSTPTGPATDVDQLARNFVSSGVPSQQFSVAIDQSTIGGSADNWPRVVGMRSLGGEDPLAQRTYLDLLDSKKLDNSGRRVFLSADVDLAWLERNGTGFVETNDPAFQALALKSHFEKVQGTPFAMYALPNATRLGSSSCPGTVDAQLQWDTIAVNYTLQGTGCAIRLTSNYSPLFRTSEAAQITPIADSLGMLVSPVRSGAGSLTVRYTNPFVAIGAWISGSTAVVLSALWYVGRRRGVARRASRSS